MECAACGYGYYWSSEEQTMVGNEEFIKIRGSWSIKQSDRVDTTIVPVEVFACPKCKTLVMKEEL